MNRLPMKRSLVVVSLVTASIAAGCGVANTKSPGRFITTFSPEDAINKSYPPADGKKQPIVSSGAALVGSSGLGVTHRSISAELLLSEIEESQFLSKFKAEVGEQLRKYGAKVTGEGTGNKGEYLEYSEGAIAGVVEIAGMRASLENYRLILIVAER
jgi:hypothetical protein